MKVYDKEIYQKQQSITTTIIIINITVNVFPYFFEYELNVSIF